MSSPLAQARPGHEQGEVNQQQQMKTCRACGLEKLLIEFYPPSSRKVCRRCKNSRTVDTSRAYRGTLKEQVLRYYSPQLICACSACPYPSPGIKFLSLDHIEGRGDHDREIRRKLYQWVKNNNFPDGFQVLCYNCNLAKRGDNTCPHNAIAPLEDSERGTQGVSDVR